MKKIFLSIGALLILIILFINLTPKHQIELGSDSLLIGYTLDDLIKKSEIIVIGEVQNKLPSQWRGEFGSNPQDASPEEIVRAQGLFTDSLISIDQILKGNLKNPVIRVRSFIGETESIIWKDDSEPIFVLSKTYLLFLAKDIGATSSIYPGDYISLGAYQGVYEIIDGKAISKTDEWLLEDLIAYIQKVLSEPTQTPTELIPEQTPPTTITPEIIISETETPIPTETITPTP